MRKNILFSLSLTLLLLAFSSFASADETLTVTTYYPSPYGSYNQLTTTGDTYLATTSANKVGIGTTSPAEKLEVSGNIKLSGASATYKITNVAIPTVPSDVATKGYVDAAGGDTVAFRSPSACPEVGSNYRKCEVLSGTTARVRCENTASGMNCFPISGCWAQNDDFGMCFYTSR